MKEIKLQNQPTSDSCTSACIAMILGVDVTSVIDEFHDDWRKRNSDPSIYLSNKGVDFTINTDPYNNLLDWDYVYLLTVPSLNLEGINHHIIVDMRGDYEKVYDPNNGKDGKKYYTGWSRNLDDDFAVHLKSWCIDMKIEL